MAKEYSDKVQKNLKTICDNFDKEDRAVRERQIRLWKKLEYYWSGFQRLWWSEVAHDWRVFDESITSDTSYLGDEAYYDKPINVFRAYLESIIAALSVTVPPIKCLPDDADNISDVLTAKGGTKIAELIYKHIDAPLLWIHALWIYCTQGMIAAYNYPSEDPKYGLVNMPEYGEVEENHIVCKNCEHDLGPQDEVLAAQIRANEIDEYMPGDDDSALHSEYNDDDPNQLVCPQCAAKLDPEINTNKVVVTRMTGVTQKPKSRQCLEVYGGLFVKVPNYARNQADSPYLALNYETHYTNVIKKFPHLRDDNNQLLKQIGSGSGGAYDPYERWGRLSTQYFGEYPLNTPTMRYFWLRPQAFEWIDEEDERKELYRLFPDGAKVVFVNDLFAEAENESLDDCWTLTYNPLSEYVHYDPLGLLLTSIQEITNDLVSLVLQTIEHGIPQTFADPEVLNFENYKNTEAAPGAIYPAKAKSGKSISDGFYEVKTATLSQEVQPFAEKVQELGQFTSGALPSLYGGQSNATEQTASQYAMSRAQSLQRLQTPWKMLTFWWKNIFAKMVPAYIENMLDDEHWVKEDSGNLINVVVKKSQMDGKIGSVELEAADQLPFTWGQKKDVIMNLLQQANPEILQALSLPENLPLLADAIGLNDFNVPGEDDREKQYEEIQLLIQSGPIPTPNGGFVSSIQPEQLVDNHGVEAQVCRDYLVSEAGRQLKIENPKGYKNILLHMQAHIQIMKANAPPPQQMQNQTKPKGQVPPPKPKVNNQRMM